MSDVKREAIRLLVFLTEDDRVGQHSAAEALMEQARVQGLAGATLWRAVEGFGRGGHLRAERLPDLARGLPLVLEIIERAPAIEEYLAHVRELAPGVLVTTEPVEVRSP